MFCGGYMSHTWYLPSVTEYHNIMPFDISIFSSLLPIAIKQETHTPRKIPWCNGKSRIS